MYVCLYVCVRIHIHTKDGRWECSLVFRCMYKTYKHIHKHMYILVSALFINTYTYICMCIYTNTHNIFIYIYMYVYIRCTWYVLHICIFIRRNYIFAGKHTKCHRSAKCARNYGTNRCIDDVKTNPLMLWHDRVVCT